MALWLSNIPVLLKSLRDNDWYITAFSFSFNGHEYVVIFEDLRELSRQIQYFSVNLTFIDYANQNRQLETYANAYKFNIAYNEVCDFFDITASSRSNDATWDLYSALNQTMPLECRLISKEYNDIILRKIENRTCHEGFCCYSVRHNGKNSHGKQIFRSGINTSKTKILRPSLFKKLGADKTISFCYRNYNEICDNDIILQLDKHRH